MKKSELVSEIVVIALSENISDVEQMLWRLAFGGINHDTRGRLISQINIAGHFPGLDCHELGIYPDLMVGRKVVEKKGSATILSRATLSGHTLSFVFNLTIRDEILAAAELISKRKNKI